MVIQAEFDTDTKVLPNLHLENVSQICDPKLCATKSEIYQGSAMICAVISLCHTEHIIILRVCVTDNDRLFNLSNEIVLQDVYFDFDAIYYDDEVPIQKSHVFQDWFSEHNTDLS